MNSRSLVFTVVAGLATVGLVLTLTREATVASVETGKARPGELPQANRAAERAPEAAPQPGPRTSGANSSSLPPIPQAALETYQVSLLDLSALAASAIPAMPHIKTRSRMQERVVVTDLELGQPRRALEVVEKIDNWRRGIGFADLAFYCAQHGHESAAPAYLDHARALVDQMTLESQAEEQGYDGDDEAIESYQSWRRDRVRAKIARTYLWLRQDEKALEFEEGLEDSEVGIVQLVRAKYMDPGRVAEAATALDAVAADGSLDKVRNALRVALELLGRFYDDEPRGTLLREKIEACLEKTPLLIQIDSLLAISHKALEKGDPSRARDPLERARNTLARNPLAVEDELPLRARLAAARHRAGEPEPARQEIEAVLQRFDREREEIPDLIRSDVLIPIAESYAEMGDEASALALYRRAAAEGAENPNAVPRVEDFVALCCSMARKGIEPDAELWRTIHAAHAALHGPW